MKPASLSKLSKTLFGAILPVLLAGALLLAAFGPASAASTAVGMADSGTDSNPLAPAATDSGNNIPVSPQPVTVHFLRNAVSDVETIQLAADRPAAFRLYIYKNTDLYIGFNGSARFQVYSPDLTALTQVLSQPGPVHVRTAQTGYYTVALLGVGQATLSFFIPALDSNTASPVPTPAVVTPISFARGSTFETFWVGTQRNIPLGYTLKALGGQVMTVTASGEATLAVLAPDRSVLVPIDWEAGQWQYKLPSNGTYTLILLGSGSVYLRTDISAIAQPVPNPVPLPAETTRLSFGLGYASTTFSDYLSSSAQGYTLRVLRGQDLYVSSDAPVDIAFYGPNGDLLTVHHSPNTYRWSVHTYTTGDYTVAIEGDGWTSLTFYVPPL